MDGDVAIIPKVEKMIPATPNVSRVAFGNLVYASQKAIIKTTFSKKVKVKISFLWHERIRQRLK